MTDQTRDIELPGVRVDMTFETPEFGIPAVDLAGVIADYSELCRLAMELAAVEGDLREGLVQEREAYAARRAQLPDKSQKKGARMAPEYEPLGTYQRLIKQKGVIVPRNEVLVLRVRYLSPLELVFLIPGAIVAAGGGLWALVQAFERVRNHGLHRELLEIERDTKAIERELARVEYLERLQLTGLSNAEGRLVRALGTADLRPSKISIEGEEIQPSS